MPSLFWLYLLLTYFTLPIFATTNVEIELKGQIVPAPISGTFFSVTVFYANSEDTYTTTTVGGGQFKIRLNAKERLEQISVQIQSLSNLGTQIRSNSWDIDEPSSDKIYKFFFGHFNPNPKNRLFLRGQFVGQLPELDAPNIYYSVLLKKQGTNIIFAQSFINGLNEAERNEWTGQKGFKLRLNNDGINYLRENPMPAMELQLITCDRVRRNETLENLLKESPLVTQSQQHRKPYFNLSNFNMKKGKQIINRRLLSGSANANISSRTDQHSPSRNSGYSGKIIDVPTSAVPELANIRDRNARHSGILTTENVGTSSSNMDYGEETESNIWPKATRNLNIKRADRDLEEEEDKLAQKQINICCLPKMVLKRNKKRTSSNSSAGNSAADDSTGAVLAQSPLVDQQGCCPFIGSFSSGSHATSSSAATFESFRKDDIGTSNANANIDNSNETKIDRKNKRISRNNVDQIQHSQEMDSSEWHGTNASLIRAGSDIDQRPTNGRMRNRSQEETSLFVRTKDQKTSSNRRLKRDIRDPPKLLLSVLIEMPVFMKDEAVEEDMFIYVFKMAPSNVIHYSSDEVNRQQMKVEQIKQSMPTAEGMKQQMPKARSVDRNRNTPSKVSSTTSSRTSKSPKDDNYFNSKQFKEQRRKSEEAMRNAKSNMHSSTPQKPIQIGEAHNKNAKTEEIAGKGKEKMETKPLTEKEQQPKKERQKIEKMGETRKSKKEIPWISSRNQSGEQQKHFDQKSLDAEGIPMLSKQNSKGSMLSKQNSKGSNQFLESDRQSEGNKQSMDQIWNKVKPNQTTVAEERQDAADEAENAESLRNKQRISTRQMEEMDEQMSPKESVMLRQIRQKMGKLNKVPSPKKAKDADDGNEAAIGQTNSDGSGSSSAATNGDNKVQKVKKTNRKNEQQQQKILESDDQNETEEKLDELNTNSDQSDQIKVKMDEAEGTRSSDHDHHHKRMVKQDQSDGAWSTRSTTPTKVKDVTPQRQEHLTAFGTNRSRYDNDVTTYTDRNDEENDQYQEIELDLNLSEAALEHLRHYLGAGQVETGLNDREEIQIVRIGTILNAWINDKHADEELSEEEETKLYEILEKIYPTASPSAVDEWHYPLDVDSYVKQKSLKKDSFPIKLFYDSEQSEPEEPLIRKKNRGQTESNESLGIGSRQNVAQINNAELKQTHGQILNSDFDDEGFGSNESPIEIRGHENLFRMVNDDIEAMQSDAASRAQVGSELQKLCQEREGNASDKCQIEDFLQSMTDTEMNWLKAKLKEKTENAKNSASDLNEMEEQNKMPKFMEKTSKLKRTTNFESDIDIKTDSELHKKRQPKKAPRLKAFGLIANKNTTSSSSDVKGQNANKSEKSANLKSNSKDVKTKQKEVMDGDQLQAETEGEGDDQLAKDQKGKENLDGTKTEDNEERADYLEWKIKMQQKGGKRHGKNEDGSKAGEWTERNDDDDDQTDAEEGFHDTFTSNPPTPMHTNLKEKEKTKDGTNANDKKQDDVATNSEQQQQSVFLLGGRQLLNKVNSWLRAKIVQGDTEPGPEQLSYLDQLKEFVAVDLDANSYPPHGLEPISDAEGENGSEARH